MTPKWSESLVKTRVDENLFTPPEGCSAEDRRRLDDLRFFCQGAFHDAERLAKARERFARAAARGEPSEVVQEVVKAVEAEFDEIEADLRFAKSRRGKFVLFANDWAQSWHAELRREARYFGVSVGSHGEQEVLMVAGEVASAEDLADLARLVGRHPPGVPVEFRVRIGRG